MSRPSGILLAGGAVVTLLFSFGLALPFYRLLYSAAFLRRLRYPIVIDGRNLYNPETMAAHGLSYYSVGRAPALPEGSPAGERLHGDNQKYE